MDKHLQSVITKRLERTEKALNHNRFDAHVLGSREELMDKLREMIPPGTSCSVGGSMTLFETGVIDFLQSGDFHYLDRYAPEADHRQIYRDAFSCQVYLTSSNAITEDGKLYNMDGNGNRVAALIYGPDRVIVIAGYNKIVADLEAARQRNRQVSAPANAQRLGKELPCAHLGHCADCSSPQRFCSSEVIIHCQMVPGRITVLLLAEELGY